MAKFLIKPRYLRRSRRSKAARVETLTLPQARDAVAAWGCKLNTYSFGARYMVRCPFDPDHGYYSTDSLVDAVDAARAMFERNQLAAHHASLALVLS